MYSSGDIGTFFKSVTGRPAGRSYSIFVRYLRKNFASLFALRSLRQTTIAAHNMVKIPYTFTGKQATAMMADRGL